MGILCLSIIFRLCKSYILTTFKGHVPFNQKLWFAFPQISSDKWNIFWNFRLRGQPREVCEKFSQSSHREFPFRLIFFSEFPDFSVEWFAFRKISNFWDFPEIFQEHFCTICLHVKSSVFFS